MAAPVCGDHLGEVVAADELGQRGEMLMNDVFDVAIRSARFLLRLSDKPLDHGGESAALGVRARGEIPRELSVEIPCLSACRVDAPIRREIAVHGHDVLLQRGRADQVKEEALSAAVLSNHESDRRPPVDDPVQIPQQRRHLARAPDLDVLEPASGHHTGCQRLENRIAITGTDPGFSGHRAVPSAPRRSPRVDRRPRGVVRRNARMPRR